MRRLRRPHSPRSALRVVPAVLLPAVLAVVPASAGDVTWSARLAFDARYDDNITQLSPKDLNRLESTGGGQGYPCGSGSVDTQGGRFTIETPDDYVAVPEVTSSLSTAWLARLPTTFGLGLTAHQFDRNQIKSWQSFRVSLDQPLHDGRYPTSIGFLYSFVPYYYQRNLRSDRTADELGVLPPPRREATYRSHIVVFQLDQDLVFRHLYFRGLLGKEGRNYNRCFDERDSEMPFQQAELAWMPRGDSKLRLRLAYRREGLNAAGDLSQTVFFTEEDISNRRSIRAGDLRFRWGKKGRAKTVTFRYEAEQRNYTTDDPNDIYHFGRIDHRHREILAARVDLRQGWFLTAFGERETNTSSFPVPPGLTFAPEDTTDFKENLYQIGFGYDFGVAGNAGPAGPVERPRD